MSRIEKIILVITDSRGVSQAFVTDDFQYLLLDEAIALVKRGILSGVHLVEGPGGTYLRSNKNTSREDNLDSLSATVGGLFEGIKDLLRSSQNGAVKAYAEAYGKFLELRHERDELLYLDGIARISKRDVIKRIRPLRRKIREAAKKYEIEVYLLAAVLIDELARLGPDDLLDILGKLGVNTSIGLAQVSMSTARKLIKQKYYPADPSISDHRLYELLSDDAISTQFAAAYLSYVKDFRERQGYGVSLAELATCYSGKPTASIRPRGSEIATKLRKFAREVID
jgi:hypothetical protein